MVRSRSKPPPHAWFIFRRVCRQVFLSSGRSRTSGDRGSTAHGARSQRLEIDAVVCCWNQRQMMRTMCSGERHLSPCHRSSVCGNLLQCLAVLWTYPEVIVRGTHDKTTSPTLRQVIIYKSVDYNKQDDEVCSHDYVDKRGRKQRKRRALLYRQFFFFFYAS